MNNEVVEFQMFQSVYCKIRDEYIYYPKWNAEDYLDYLKKRETDSDDYENYYQDFIQNYEIEDGTEYIYYYIYTILCMDLTLNKNLYERIIAAALVP